MKSKNVSYKNSKGKTISGRVFYEINVIKITNTKLDNKKYQLCNMGEQYLEEKLIEQLSKKEAQ